MTNKVMRADDTYLIIKTNYSRRIQSAALSNLHTSVSILMK